MAIRRDTLLQLIFTLSTENLIGPVTHLGFVNFLALVRHYSKLLDGVVATFVEFVAHNVRALLNRNIVSLCRLLVLLDQLLA